MTLLRRAITVPLATALMIGVLTVWPVLLVVGGRGGADRLGRACRCGRWAW